MLWWTVHREAHHPKRNPKKKEFLELTQLIDKNHTLIIKKTWKNLKDISLVGATILQWSRAASAQQTHEMDGGQS
jgi:hypothetical protein